MDADGSLWLPCCNFILYLQCISVGLSIKAVHLDKEVRFLLFGPSGSDPGTSEFDLTRLVLSAGIATEYFSVLWMREFFMSLYFTLFCYFCFFFSHSGHYLFYRQGRLRAQKQMHRQKQFFGVLSG